MPISSLRTNECGILIAPINSRAFSEIFSLVCIFFCRGPNLRRSLTSERESKYNPSEFQASTYSSSAREVFDSSHSNNIDLSGGGSQTNNRVPASPEARLLDSVTTPGGVRLQPSRETVQNFLTGAVKLDAERLVQAFENKLSAHSWQVWLLVYSLVLLLFEQLKIPAKLRNYVEKQLFKLEILSWILSQEKGSEESLRKKMRLNFVCVLGTLESHVYSGGTITAR